MRCSEHLNKALCQSFYIFLIKVMVQSFVCVWQVHFKQLANNKKLYLAYLTISMGYIPYTRLSSPHMLSSSDLTENRAVNELCNLLKTYHIMWKKLKHLSRPTVHILSPWEVQLCSMTDPTHTKLPSWALSLCSRCVDISSLLHDPK